MYVVAGVTGNTGSFVARYLLSQGKRVRVIVRDSDRGEDWERQGAEVALGTLLDADFLTKTLHGAEGAYLLVPPDFTTGDLGRHQREIVEVLVRAVSESALPHLVFLSSIGAQHRRGVGPIAALSEAEERLRALPRTRSTLLRPAYFMENWRGLLAPVARNGVLFAFFRPDLAIPMIAAEDVGRFAAEALLAPPAATEVRQLAGPREYNHKDVAALFGTLLGARVQVVPVPSEGLVETRIRFGLPADVAQLYAALDTAIDAGRVAFEKGLPIYRGEVTLDAVLSRMLRGAR